MINFSIKADSTTKYITFPFIKNNKSLESEVKCGLTLIPAGNMRFRWNEENPVRKELLTSISKNPVPLELIHSQTVVDIKNKNDTFKMQADGMITKNPELMPVITVADCVPIYLYDSVTKVFGVVHSGWKGTGIIREAILLAQKNYGSKPEDFSVVIGPHIKNCCYIVNEERAEYFRNNFSKDCVVELEKNGTCYCGGRGLPIVWNNGGGKLYRLSLEKANLAVLEKTGVKSENIGVCSDCTCCTEICGSNRRQTAINIKENNIDTSKLSVEEQSKLFTVMAAFTFSSN
ncbi:MAG: polyphenol oxidase family protein [Treponema sp.]|nr:polyphenol oxidase family protein [Treponema sp.]